MASIVEKIRRFNEGRLPDMLKRKYTLMGENAFSFFRATSHLFYEDLVRDFQLKDATKVWSCADLHLQNFGTFRAVNRLVYFDLNDFDDAALLPATYDLVRMAVSIHLVSKYQKWDAATNESLILAFLDSYKNTLQGGKPLDIDHRMSEGELRSFIKKLEKKDNSAFVTSFLDKSGKRFRADSKKLLPVDEKKYKEVEEHIDGYFSKHHSSFFKKVKDIKFRVAGTASLGLERYAILIETTKKANEDLLILDLKEARPSTVAPFTAIPQPTWSNQAERITSVQNYVNDVLPALFGAIEFGTNSFVMREMQAEEDKFDVLSPIKPAKFQTVLSEMGIATASGHLRSTGRKGSIITDDLIDFAQQNAWHEQVITYAQNYAKKVQSDFEEFSKAVKDNSIEHTPLSIMSTLD